ncbi:MAG: hypothetical protein LBP51_00530 [Deferribacteraceae bacterium]|jgi:hypothetical protein|nr:hypothetical protein [Deferribacteraceae bacterium]
MLSGLRSVAGLLAAGQQSKSFSKFQSPKAPLKEKRSLFVKQNNPGYYKDNYGVIRTPSGSPLFSVSEKYNIGLDGTIFEYDKPVGVLRMFDVASDIVSAEDALVFRLSPPILRTR